MSKVKDDGDLASQSVHIPVMLTNSAMEILEFYAEDIIEIRATGTSRTTNRDELIRDINLNRSIATEKEVTLDYTRITNRSGEVENPLSQDVIDHIRRKLRTKLYASSVDAQPDLSVEYLKVDATIPRLKEKTRARTDEFELTFVSESVQTEGYERATNLANMGKGLYTELMFNYKNLSLRRVEEVSAKYSQQSNPQIMSWNGVKDTRPQGFKRTASEAISDTALPDSFGELKRYEVGEEEQMQPVGRDAEDADVDTENGGSNE
jgi:hypothetical protein